MSSDLRRLMHDLAEEAPPIDNRIALADASYTSGLRRRRVRRLEISSASVIGLVLVLLGSIFVGSTPVAARYGSSGGSTIHQHPRQISAQWPVLALPARPGPLALVMRDNNTWYGVSASGHRWSLPFITLSNGSVVSSPLLSDDGRLLGYVGEGDVYVVRDLVTGHRTVFPKFAHDAPSTDATPYNVNPYENGYFSADGRYLAVEGESRAGGSQIFVLDLATGRTRSWRASTNEETVIAGWLTDDQLVLSSYELVVGQQLTTRDLDGKIVATVRVKPAVDGSVVTYGAAAALTPDRTAVALLTDSGLVVRYGLTSGQPTGTATRIPSAAPCWWAATADALAVSSLVDTETGQFNGLRVGDGETKTLTTVADGVHTDCVRYALNAVEGPARSPLLLDRVDRWLVLSRWYELGALALGGLVVARRRRRQSV